MHQTGVGGGGAGLKEQEANIPCMYSIAHKVGDNQHPALEYRDELAITSAS